MTTLAGKKIKSKWDVREAARLFYPNDIHLQRKWLRAWRRAPSPRCAVGTRADEQKLDALRQRARQR